MPQAFTRSARRRVAKERKMIMNLGNRFQFSTIVILMALFLFPGILPAQSQHPGPDKAASVNGTVITVKTLDHEVDLLMNRMAREGRQVQDAQIPAIKNEILESLIAQELLYQKSQKSGVKVDAKDLDGKMESIKGRFQDEDAYKKAIAAMEVTEEEMKRKMKKNLAIDALLKDELAGKMTVTDAESKKFYDEHPALFKRGEQVKASHILVKVDPSAGGDQKAEARKKIESIQKKLKKGEDFAAMAKEYSQCPSSSRGGDLGYFERGKMVKPFEDAAFALAPNQVSGVVETQFGYHLIKVLDKRPESAVAYNDVKERLTEHLKKAKMRQEVQSYIQELRKEATIEKFI